MWQIIIKFRKWPSQSFFVIGAFGLLIGPGIGGATTVLGAAFTFGGIFGGAKLILVAKVIGDLVVVEVLTPSPLVRFEVPFAIPLLNGFFAGAVLGRLNDLGEPLVSVCLLINVDVRGVLVFGGVDGFVITVDFGVGLLEVVVLVREVRGVVDVVLAEFGRDEDIAVLGTVFGSTFAVTVDVFKTLVFGAVVGRTLAVGLEVVDGAVNGLDIGFEVVVDAVVFLIGGVDVFEDNGFVGVVFVVVVLTLETVVSTFLGVDFLDVKLAPVTAAIAAAPTTVAIAISET